MCTCVGLKGIHNTGMDLELELQMDIDLEMELEPTRVACVG